MLTYFGSNLSSFMEVEESFCGRFGLATRANAAPRHAWAGVLAVIFRIELLDPPLPVWCYFDKPNIFSGKVVDTIRVIWVLTKLSCSSPFYDGSLDSSLRPQPWNKY